MYVYENGAAKQKMQQKSNVAKEKKTHNWIHTLRD